MYSPEVTHLHTVLEKMNRHNEKHAKKCSCVGLMTEAENTGFLISPTEDCGSDRAVCTHAAAAELCAMLSHTAQTNLTNAKHAQLMFK